MNKKNFKKNNLEHKKTSSKSKTRHQLHSKITFSADQTPKATSQAQQRLGLAITRKATSKVICSTIPKTICMESWTL